MGQIEERPPFLAKNCLFDDAVPQVGGGEGGTTGLAPWPFGSPALRDDDLRRLLRLVEPSFSGYRGYESVPVPNVKRPHAGAF